MTIPRMVGLLAALTAIGIAAVVMRVEQVRHMRRIQELQFAQTELRQKIWTQEMQLARLRSPQMIRERAAFFSAESAEPAAPATTPVRRQAGGRR